MYKIFFSLYKYTIKFYQKTQKTTSKLELKSKAIFKAILLK